MSDQEQPSGGTSPRIVHLTNCPKCGSANPPDTRYCVRCGASLAVVGGDGAEVQTQKKQGLLARLLRR